MSEIQFLRCLMKTNELWSPLSNPIAYEDPHSDSSKHTLHLGVVQLKCDVVPKFLEHK
jgi:hypothetical protein